MSTVSLPAGGTPASAASRRGPALLRHSVALAHRSLIKTFRTPEALIDVTIQPAIFLVLFTYVFGGAIAAGSQHDYLQYLLPGILAQTIALAGATIGVNLNDDIASGVFDRFRSLPISRAAPLVGKVLADLVRYVLLFTVTLGFGYVLGFRVQTGVLDVLAAGALVMGFALCLSWVSVWIGMMVRTPDAVQGITMLVLFPLTFASSTFVKADTLPGWLQTVVDLNPLTHLVDSLRALLLGGPRGDDLLWTLLSMAALLVVFVPLALRAYARRA
ncbi:ABC transporter permease [Patulibacter sp. NPDC049589]|uniref:ABC transporter permease n=1 Tax=Patulibacter sp. NPDC049589 TaxID=3154731 RepID=UPI0034350127